MTLLEVLLALGLTGVVMVVISMAIHLHLITVDTRRADIEQAQVARGVLQHIAADIRNTVWYEPLDMSSLTDMTAVPGSSGDSGSSDSSSGQESAGGQEQQGQSGQQAPGQQDGESGGGESESEPEVDMGSLDLLGDMGLDTTEPSEKGKAQSLVAWPWVPSRYASAASTRNGTVPHSLRWGTSDDRVMV